MSDRPASKRVKLELFDLPVPTAGSRSLEEMERAYREAVKTHPFHDNAHCIADVYANGVLRDGQGNVLGVLVKQGLPEYATKMAAEVLRPAATRTSLRANIYGGEAPLSGIAGYFDYRGSPIEFKYRKTAFTYENEEVWPAVFPMIDYVSQIYKRAMPENWAKQDAAIPDVVRIHGSPFSTLTINSRFRTAHHTDAGDFDDGYGCLACLEGPFQGLALTFDHFRVNFVMQPRDVLIFNTHHFHSNTEPELINNESWQRLTCVFYYRAALGEAAGYAEYRRRLEESLSSGKDLSLVRAISPVKAIVEKYNGENHNRAAAVHKLQLSPFAFTTLVYQLCHAGATGGLLHELLLAQGERVEVALFGEPLYQSRGIPAREEADMELLHMPPSLFKAPAMGGFKECDVTVQAASEKQKLLDPDYLAQHVSRELLEMWQEARAQWLDLVKADWKKLLSRDAQRTNFTWNNRSQMNAAFFDLCEVGKQVLLAVFGKETATPKEEQSFWALFAAHLNAACVSLLQMPPDAMSLTKLNVKIKDFTFGGTRYFRDMPPEEQKRRLERKARIEAARRVHHKDNDPAQKRGEWLSNDSFDYQTEDRPVEYVGLQRATPEDNARAVVRTPSEILEAVHKLSTQDDSTEGGTASSPQQTVRVLVVLPASQPLHRGSRASSLVADLPVELRAGAECQRLLGNPAAKRLLAAPPVNQAVPPAETFTDKRGNTFELVYADTATCGDAAGAFDFVVLQHVLSTVADTDAVTAFVAKAASLAAGAVLVVETDLQDRQYYRLLPRVRKDYDAVAPECYRVLHRAKYGTPTACLRTKAELEALVPSCCVRYKLVGSPLNSTILILPGTKGQM